MTNRDGRYRELDHQLRALSATLGGRLPGADRRMLDELIEVNEFGLALETLIDALAEEKIEPSPATIGEMERLAEQMGMGEGKLDRLRSLAPR